MKISAIETRARSLANLSNTEAISHDDVDSSANEAWKDIYARLLESDDDYWTKIQTFTSITAYATGNPNEYLIPLPTDFYKLRAVDWQGGKWREMHKFAMSLRDEEPSEPHYRFDGTSLWVIGANVTQVRIRYYPPPDTLTHPDADLQYATSVAPNNFLLISSPAYSPWQNTMVYVYNAQNILAASIDSNTVAAPITLLAAGVTVSNLVYYKGYLYYLAPATGIRRAPSDLVTTPIVPATIVANINITQFSILNDTVYYCTTTDLRSCTLSGGSDVQLAPYVGTSICADSAGGVYFTEATTNHLHKLFVTDPIDSTTLHVTTDGQVASDGSVGLYLLHTNYELHKATVNSAFTVITHEHMRTDIKSIAQWAADRIPAITRESQELLAISSFIDSDITYPSNTLTEIIAFQMAIDFKTKFNEDFTQLKIRLGDPQSNTGLWATFNKLAKRDEYEPERIKNSRAVQGSWM